METLPVALAVRDVEPEDLPGLQWSGGSAHLRAVAESWQRSLEGEVVLVCVEASNGQLVGLGGLDLSKDPVAGELWMLAVHEAWQSLGVGTRLVRALEQAAAQHGRTSVQLSVEDDNPGAAALYERLGYREVGRRRESWPLDDGTTFTTTTTLLRREL
ncbi:Ribosomal protein S18 acetylase RimI [Auraticoccus monumenti]|uniref:Ribosomal protein S18 acetylase RimI n=1 Tax=Auraticoccus monumenti TaxID=675864 RepID=A0A1G7F1U2_9ACTN|nr:Ribosomal protein S18 acetylase RimI [Auraticoccus monumenti]